MVRKTMGAQPAFDGYFLNFWTKTHLSQEVANIEEFSVALFEQEVSPAIEVATIWACHWTWIKSSYPNVNTIAGNPGTYMKYRSLMLMYEEVVMDARRGGRRIKAQKRRCHDYTFDRLTGQPIHHLDTDSDEHDDGASQLRGDDDDNESDAVDDGEEDEEDEDEEDEDDEEEDEAGDDEYQDQDDEEDEEDEDEEDEEDEDEEDEEDEDEEEDDESGDHENQDDDEEEEEDDDDTEHEEVDNVETEGQDKGGEPGVGEEGEEEEKENGSSQDDADDEKEKKEKVHCADGRVLYIHKLIICIINFIFYHINLSN